MKRSIGQAFIGTSNVVIPGNKLTFPEDFQKRSRLHYYSTLFNTVEVNSCFYKSPLHSTYQKWTREVGENFQFSLKVSKEITHVKELRSEIGCMEKFMSSATGTGDKKGCLLIQFPGKISLEYFNQVESILAELNQHDPENNWRKAVEFRNASWYIGETDDLLQEYQANIVLHDMAKGKIQELRNDPPFVYMRFHGPEGNYRGSYTESFLERKAAEIQLWLGQGKTVYAYFNNTLGSGFENAKKLQSMVEK